MTSGTINLKTVLRDFILGLAVGLIVSYVVPIGKIAVDCAFKLKAQPQSKKFNIIVGAVYAIMFATIMSTAMSLIGGCVIGHAPVAPVFLGNLTTLYIYIIAAFIASLIITKSMARLAHKLAN